MPHIMLIEAQGQYGSDDVRAWAEDEGVCLTVAPPGEEFGNRSDLGWHDARRLGEWLIAQAIAHGARRGARSGGER